MKQGEDSESEEEQVERIDAKKAKFTLTWKDLNKIQPTQKVVVCNSGAPQALFRILFDDSLEDVASVEVLTEETKKTDTVLEVKRAGDLLLLFNKGVEAKMIGELMAGLGPKLGDATVIALAAIYKTTYGTSQGHFSIEDGQPLPLRITKSSFSNPIVDGLAKQIELDTQFNFTGGLNAALLMEAEMHGRGAASIKAIVD